MLSLSDAQRLCGRGKKTQGDFPRHFLTLSVIRMREHCRKRLRVHLRWASDRPKKAGLSKLGRDLHTGLP